MKVTMLLADHAAVAEGKLYINGGGWTVTGPGPAAFSIVMYIEVPWDQANMKHALQLDLVDADGQPVMGDTVNGEERIGGGGEFEVTRPLGVKAGTPIPLPVALNFDGLPLPSGGRFEWQLSIDGETDEDWRLSFSTRPRGPESMAA